MFGRSLDDSGLAATPRCCPPIIVQHPGDVTCDVTRRHDNSSPSSTSSSSRESGIKSTSDSSSPEPHTDPHHHYHHDYHHHWRQQQQQQQTRAAAAAAVGSIPDDVPLDLSVTPLSLPWQHVNDDEASSVHRRHDNDSQLSAPSVVNQLPLLSNANCTVTPHSFTRCHDNDSRLSTPSVVDQLPLLSNAHCAVTPRNFTRCHNNDSRLSTPSVVDHPPLLSNAHCTLTPPNFTRRHDNGRPISFVDKDSPLLSNAHWSLQPRPVFPQSPRSMIEPAMPPTHHTPVDTNTRLPEPAKQLLTSWYETHIRHPYPQPDELTQLVALTGQSRRKILKWLANRRARTGNTLPHNGSVHPRKIVKIRQLRQLEGQAEPRLRQRATSNRQRSSRFLPDCVVDGLQRWYDDHLGYPYPTDAEKRHLAEQLGTTVVKVTNWFSNKRNRSGLGRTGSVRRYDASSLGTQSALQRSQLHWRYNLASFPHSLSASLERPGTSAVTSLHHVIV